MSTTGDAGTFTEADLRAAVRRSGEGESYVQALLADMREHREPEHRPEAPAVPDGLTRSERDLVMADLGQLLEVLGLGNYARPEPPHEVMQQCIAKAARLRNGARVLGRVVTGHGRAMEAARIELAQGSADKAMEWILNSLPDLWDDPETAWDGKESAGEWFTRTESFYRAAESAPESSRDPGPPDDTTRARTAAPDGTRERADSALERLLTIISEVDAHIDARTAAEYQEQPLARHWSRITKVCSEAGEVMDALSAATGENPRKGVHGTWSQVTAELGDVLCAAAFAIQHVTKDESATAAVVMAAFEKAHARVAAVEADRD